MQLSSFDGFCYVGGFTELLWTWIWDASYLEAKAQSTGTGGEHASSMQLSALVTNLYDTPTSCDIPTKLD